MRFDRLKQFAKEEAKDIDDIIDAYTKNEALRVLGSLMRRHLESGLLDKNDIIKVATDVDQELKDHVVE